MNEIESAATPTPTLEETVAGIVALVKKHSGRLPEADFEIKVQVTSGKEPGVTNQTLSVSVLKPGGEREK